MGHEYIQVFGSVCSQRHFATFKTHADRLLKFVFAFGILNFSDVFFEPAHLPRRSGLISRGLDFGTRSNHVVLVRRKRYPSACHPAGITRPQRSERSQCESDSKEPLRRFSTLHKTESKRCHDFLKNEKAPTQILCHFSDTNHFCYSRRWNRGIITGNSRIWTMITLVSLLILNMKSRC